MMGMERKKPLRVQVHTLGDCTLVAPCSSIRGGLFAMRGKGHDFFQVAKFASPNGVLSPLGCLDRS